MHVHICASAPAHVCAHTHINMHTKHIKINPVKKYMLLVTQVSKGLRDTRKKPGVSGNERIIKLIK